MPGVGRTMTRMPIPTFREIQDEIAAQLREQGYLATVLINLGSLAQIEKSFGAAACRSLRDQVDPLLEEMQERFRSDDLLARDEREGDRFLLFLSGPRLGNPRFQADHLRKLVERVEEYVNPRVGRLTLPYLRERPRVGVGYGLVLWTPSRARSVRSFASSRTRLPPRCSAARFTTGTSASA